MKTLALQNRTHKIGLAVLIIITVSILSLLAGCAKKEEVSSVPAVEGKSSVQTSEHPETEASEEQPEAEAEDTVPDRVADDERPMVYAHVNGSTLTIMPSENDSANAFIDLLREGDITVDMHDYGGFEKVGSLGTTLPRNDEQITTEPGDVTLYQGDQITIYYDVNSWSFTRLGKVQGKTQDELKGILGTGDVKVVFSLDAETDETEENITVGTFDFETHTVLLNSGHKMPIIGLGTWTLSNDEAENSTYHALKNGMRKKAVLLAVAWDNTKTVFKVTKDYYDTICDYMNFKDYGVILGGGCGTPSMTKASVYPDKAYELGKSL